LPQQVAVIERLREPHTFALAKGDDRLGRADVRLAQSYQAHDAFVALRDRLLEQYKEELPPPVLSPEQEHELLPEGAIPPILRSSWRTNRTGDPATREIWRSTT
jgi:hypothetical protein